MKRTYFYKFADGYFCFSACILKGEVRKLEIRKHGSIIEELAFPPFN